MRRLSVEEEVEVLLWEAANNCTGRSIPGWALHL